MSGNIDRFSDPSAIPDIPTENKGSYSLSGKIMVSTIFVLLFVVVLTFTLHLYARCYLIRARRLRSRNGRWNQRRTQLVFYDDPNANAAPEATTGGLDTRVLKSLPVFTFSSKTHPDSALECSVCLSEFEENESGRVLPKCNHSFHLECIDMWFHSHSTCPLCRTSVEESVPVSENPGDLVLTINESSGGESGSSQSSDLCATSQRDEGQAGTSAVGYRRKLSIEVPRRNTEGVEGESSGGPSQSYKSPISRKLSFKRILTRERTINESPGGESGSRQSSDLCATCQDEEGQAGMSAVGYRRKLSIEVPRRNTEGFEGESSGCESGPSQSYKSPMSRMLSFKRILSRERRRSGASSCPSPINAGSCGSITVSELDIERGGNETRQTQG